MINIGDEILIAIEGGKSLKVTVEKKLYRERLKCYWYHGIDKNGKRWVVPPKSIKNIND